MDLKEQLVIWKKSGYILDTVTMTPGLCDAMVEAGLLSADMMSQIQALHFHVEKTLKMLTFLGSHGSGVYKKFLRILELCGHSKVANELRKTYQFTHFGEMLPPAFTYFLDLSDFLRKYVHISRKLGEDEKHLLQAFIEGKIEMEHRKQQEDFDLVQKDNEKLKKVIAEQQGEIAELKHKQNQLETELAQVKDTIEAYRKQAEEMERQCDVCRAETRRLKHFRSEQKELEDFITEQSERYGVLSESKQAMDRDSKLATGKASMLRMRLLLSKVNLMVNKLYYIQHEVEHMSKEEARLVQLLKQNTIDPSETREAKKVLSELRKEKKSLEQQVKESEKFILLQDKEIQEIRQAVYGMPTTPDSGCDGTEHLKGQMYDLLEAVRAKCREEIKELHVKQDKQVADFVKAMQDMQVRHQDETEKQKWKYKQKMVELHKREQLHRRMRNQIHVMTRFHAKNMNASQTVEQCRKIVRQIIAEARKLKDIAEEQEKNIEEMTEEEKKKVKEEEEKKNKKKQKRKRRKWNALANERLMFIADRMMMKWRLLGTTMGITNNRMDMAEYEVSSPDKAAFNMLKMWRDEDFGKAEQLVNALKELGRPDLALIVTPAHRVEIIQKADGTLAASGMAQEEGLHGEEVELEQEVLVTMGARKSPSNNNLANVPKLPLIGAHYS